MHTWNFNESFCNTFTMYSLLMQMLMHTWNFVERASVIPFTTIGHRDTVCTVDFSSDGILVASGGLDGQINVWNTATRTFQGTLDGSGAGFEVRPYLVNLIHFNELIAYAIPLFS